MTRLTAPHPDLQALRAPILEAIGKHLDLRTHRVFVFGSRATGHAHERSDIDIGIEGEQEIPGETMEAIRDELERIPIMHTIEFVDMRTTSPAFQRLAFRKVIPLN